MPSQFPGLELYLKEVVKFHNITLGSNVHLSVDLFALARCLKAGRHEVDDLALTVLRFFTNEVGNNGTVVISAFSFDFSNSGYFSPIKCTPDTGSFAKIIAKYHSNLRTLGPIYSFFVFGHLFKVMFGPMPAATGPQSVFRILVENRFTLLSVGHHSASAFTVSHHFEESAGVPYRFSKSFVGVIESPQGEIIPWDSTMYVRQNNCVFSGLTVEGHERLVEDGVAKVLSSRLGNDPIASFSIRLAEAAEPIESDLYLGGSRYIAPVIDGLAPKVSATPITSKRARFEYLSAISLG
jgi:aminoglycoside N3'-acetyltransferase